MTPEEQILALLVELQAQQVEFMEQAVFMLQALGVAVCWILGCCMWRMKEYACRVKDLR